MSEETRLSFVPYQDGDDSPAVKEIEIPQEVVDALTDTIQRLNDLEQGIQASDLSTDDVSNSLNSVNDNLYEIDKSAGIAAEKATEAYTKAVEGWDAANQAAQDILGINTRQDEADIAISNAWNEAVSAGQAAATADSKGESALATAGQALNAANGKNKVFRSTSNPSGAGTATGDIWWKYSSGSFTGPIIGQWTWSGSEWSPSTIDSSVIASLTVDKLTVTGGAKIPVAVINTLVGDSAFFKSLTADKLMIGSISNLIPNGDVTRSTVDPWSSSLTRDTSDKPGAFTAALRTPSVATSLSDVNGSESWVEVTPGTQMYFDVWVKADKTGSKMSLTLLDQSGATAIASSRDTEDEAGSLGETTTLVNSISVPTTWTRYASILTLKSTSRRIKLGTLTVNESGGVQTATVRIAGVRLRARSTTDTLDSSILSGVEGAISDTRDSLASSISDMSNSITTQVSSTYATKDELESNRDSTYVAIAAVADNASSQIADVSSALEELGAAYTSSQERLDLFVNIDENGIILGNRQNEKFKVRITNTEMSFLQDNKVVAYISNNKLYITNAEIRNNLALGSPSTGFFDFVPRSNGNLSFKFRGAS